MATVTLNSRILQDYLSFLGVLKIDFLTLATPEAVGELKCAIIYLNVEVFTGCGTLPCL